MERIKCLYGPEPADYYCSCTTPQSSYCRKHLEIHENSSSVEHRHTLYKKASSLTPNPSTKQQIIAKIQEAKISANKELEKLIMVTSETILKTEKLVAAMQERLLRFTSLCNQIIEEISSIDSIPQKEILAPLEFALISSDPSLLLEKITHPVITFSETGQPLYTPTTFPHFLYNYSDLGMTNISEKVIQVCTPLYRQIVSDALTWSSRCLNVGNRSLLVTGGVINDTTSKNNAYILDIQSGNIKELPPLNHAREWHAMAWFEGYPGAIGGKNNHEHLRSVEIFTNSQWVEIDSIALPRDSCSAVNTYKTVFVAGGIYDSNSLNTIEKYYEKKWTVLMITLPSPLNCTGLCCVEDNLLFFGGRINSLTLLNKIFSFDTQNHTFTEVGTTDTAIYFPYNHFFVGLNEIVGLGRNHLKENKEIRVALNKLRIT